MAILVFFLIHWYLSIFFQTFFHHRYAAHQMFTMTKGWERFFHVMSFIAQGSSYLSPYAYGILHRRHHAFTDTIDDPHSPKHSKNMLSMMWDTKVRFTDIFKGKTAIDAKEKLNLPEWRKFDEITNTWLIRLAWGLFYIGFYVIFATQWWMYLLLPLHFVMGPLHGAIVNWVAHKYGYTNFAVNNTSKNILPFDFLLLGEGYHNNHHKKGNSPNFGYRWFEIDPVFISMWVMDKFRIIRLKKPLA